MKSSDQNDIQKLVHNSKTLFGEIKSSLAIEAEYEECIGEKSYSVSVWDSIYLTIYPNVITEDNSITHFELGYLDDEFNIFIKSLVENRQSLQPLYERPELADRYIEIYEWIRASIPKIQNHIRERERTTKDLLNELERVFPSYGLDGGISMTQAFMLDDCMSLAEHKDDFDLAYEAEIKDDWRKIPDDILYNDWGSMPGLSVWLDKKGARFYIPAFIRCILNKFILNPTAELETEVEFYWRLNLLNGPQDNPDIKWCFANNTLEFTREQSAMITKYLLFVKEREPKWFQDINNLKYSNTLNICVENYL